VNRAVDIYCERLGPGLWAEPLNALTNLAFILAGILLVVALRRAEPAVRGDAGVLALTALVFVIGFGSGLFHTVATAWAGLADVVPIALFILLYLFLALRRFVTLPLWACGLGVAAMLLLTVVLPLTLHIGLSSYGAALAALLLVGGFLQFGRRHPAGPRLLVAGGLFALSLAFRTADAPLCNALPIGTHFLWHVFNAAVLYSLVRTMMAHGMRPQAGDGRRGA